MKEKLISSTVGKGVVNASKMNTQRRINKKELVKLLVRGFSPSVEPWKELVRHMVEHVQPIGRSSAPWPSDMN
jgi:hypothetical protein